MTFKSFDFYFFPIICHSIVSFLFTKALPDAVHGSAQFSRGETSVLCTVTLGSPRDGMADQDPFDSLRRSEPEDTVGGSSSDFHALPVGSLRFLRTQEALVSDLNSRKVQAERELTGSTGSLAEFKRAFLQYDFPDYCNGRVPSGGGQINNRRAIGHGALAEKAILPCLPSPGTFPYAIRMTSEVTDSNGSSSMATACGTTLALLDAGVPLLSPVAGISVGLAATEDESPCENALVLDITGNEVSLTCPLEVGDTLCLCVCVYVKADCGSDFRLVRRIIMVCMDSVRSCFQRNICSVKF